MRVMLLRRSLGPVPEIPMPAILAPVRMQLQQRIPHLLERAPALRPAHHVTLAFWTRAFFAENLESHTPYLPQKPHPVFATGRALKLYRLLDARNTL